MKYIDKSFTLPTTTVNMTTMLYDYRTGKISAEEYEQITGHKPDEESYNPDDNPWHGDFPNPAQGYPDDED